MIINKEGKLFGKLSIIDALVIIGVIVLLVGVWLRFFSPAARTIVTQGELEYVMRVHAVRPQSVVALQNVERIQGEVVDSRTGEALGRIISVVPEPTRWEMALIDGDWVYGYVPGRQDAIVTIRVDGRVSETGFLTFQNRSLAVASHIGILSKYADTTGEIMEIRLVED